MDKKFSALVITAGACLWLTFAGNSPAEAGKTWNHNVSLGLNLNRGDADSLHVSSALDGKGQWNIRALSYALSGSYGRSDGVVNRERLSGRTEYRQDFSDYYFWTINASGETDRVGGIDYLVDTGTGIGYYLTRTERKVLSVQPGLAWVMRRCRSTEGENYLAFQLNQKFEYLFSEKARLWQSARYLPNIEESWNDYSLGFECGVSAPLGEISSLRLVLENLFHSRPARDKSRNNLSLTAYLSWKI